MERAQYDRFAQVDAQHWWFRGRRQLAQSVISSLDLPAQATVLDVGNGTGGMIPVLSKFGQLNVYEPDLDTSNLTKSTYEKNFENVNFFSGDQLPTNLEKYDLITAFDVLEHCEDDNQALLTWSNLLKNNGYLVITVPAFPSLWGDNDVVSHHYRRYTHKSLLSVLEKASFEVRKISYTNLAAFVPVWLSRNVKEKLEASLKKKDDIPWDFNLPPSPLNALLLSAVSWEPHWLTISVLPFGTSLIAVARNVK